MVCFLTQERSIETPHQPYRLHWPTVWSSIQDHYSLILIPFTSASATSERGVVCSSMIELSKPDYYAATQWRDWVIVGRCKWRLIAARLSWVSVAANSTQPCSTVKFLPRPTACFSSVPDSLKLWRLKARRRDSCLIALNTFINSKGTDTATLSSRKPTVRLRHQTTTKSTLYVSIPCKKG